MKPEIMGTQWKSLSVLPGVKRQGRFFPSHNLEVRITFAEWRSDLSELRGQLALGHLASVIGLAPIRPGLKDRLRELLCIHGLLA